ncbi:hypothetical protein VFPPC_15943 [Pochonia chlamydosporia 170]|uniref:Uncharacterized protein n=1 Tax=Pochonia chlamydosporia 170 TaxID=1380566 RepID=A0A179FWB4_METCM|nr:hypothetical protein VFPPC_15943 [Pochonia chlamydosporia 170]OAQ69279.1 hypothetical protein VFPPC_15943 [Pochonia chlamydosporia 170]
MSRADQDIVREGQESPRLAWTRSGRTRSNLEDVAEEFTAGNEPPPPPQTRGRRRSSQTQVPQNQDSRRAPSRPATQRQASSQREAVPRTQRQASQREATARQDPQRQPPRRQNTNGNRADSWDGDEQEIPIGLRTSDVDMDRPTTEASSDTRSDPPPQPDSRPGPSGSGVRPARPSESTPRDHGRQRDRQRPADDNRSRRRGNAASDPNPQSLHGGTDTEHYDDGDGVPTFASDGEFESDNGESDDGEPTYGTLALDGQLQERNGRQYFKFVQADTGIRETARIEGKAPSKNIVIFSTRPLEGHGSRPAYARRMAEVGLSGVAIDEIHPMKKAEFAEFRRDGRLGILLVASLSPVPEPLQQHPMTWIKVQSGDDAKWIARSTFVGGYKEGQAFINRHYEATGQDPPPQPLPVAERRQLQAEGQRLRRNPVRAARPEQPPSPPASSSRQNATPEVRRTPRRTARRSRTNQDPPTNSGRGNRSSQEPLPPRSPSPNHQRSTNQEGEDAREHPNPRRRVATRQQSGTFPEEVRASYH